MITLEDIRFHYAMMQNALLIMSGGVGNIKQAQSDYAVSRQWLQTNDAIGQLLKVIDEMEGKTNNA